MKNILFTGAYRLNEDEIKKITELGYRITSIDHEDKYMSNENDKFDAIIANNFFVNNNIEKFKNLKYVQLTSSGMEKIPLDYIKSKNISLYNAENAYSIPMAEWVVLKILELYKNSFHFYKNQNKKLWEKNRNLKELYHSTVSIIGLGNVGKEVAVRLKGFGVEIYGVGRSEVNDNEKFVDRYYQISDMISALSKSDVIVLTLPLTDQTFHLINKEVLSKLKKDVVLINVSRGNIIDEDALINSLINNNIGGLALDVFKKEPLPKDHKLWEFRNAIISPHNSFVSTENSKRIFDVIYKNLSRNVGKSIERCNTDN